MLCTLLTVLMHIPQEDVQVDIGSTLPSQPDIPVPETVPDGPPPAAEPTPAEGQYLVRRALRMFCTLRMLSLAEVLHLPVWLFNFGFAS